MGGAAGTDSWTDSWTGSIVDSRRLNRHVWDVQLSIPETTRKSIEASLQTYQSAQKAKSVAHSVPDLEVDTMPEEEEEKEEEALLSAGDQESAARWQKRRNEKVQQLQRAWKVCGWSRISVLVYFCTCVLVKMVTRRQPDWCHFRWRCRKVMHLRRALETMEITEWCCGVRREVRVESEESVMLVSVCFFDSSIDLSQRDGEQESSEGRRFEALRSNLPAFKEKDLLLEAVARSQVRKSNPIHEQRQTEIRERWHWQNTLRRGWCGWVRGAP